MKLSELIRSNDEAYTPPVRLVDGHYFFCRAVDVPTEMEPGEVAGFAELTIEELSPFPLEQLAWGYLQDDTERRLFLYAASRTRIPAAEQMDWEQAEFVYPNFLPLVLAEEKRARMVGVRGERSLTLMQFDEGSRFPKRLVSAELPESGEAPTDEDFYALADKLRSRLQMTDNVDDDGLMVVAIHEAARDKVVFRSTLSGLDDEAHAARFEISGDTVLWRADLRDPDFIESERKRRVGNQRVGWALAAAGGAMAVMLLLTLITLLGGWLVEHRKSFVASQDAAAYAVQQNMDFLFQIEQFASAPFRPFYILELANGILMERKPRKITFDSASLSANQDVVIQGTAGSVDEVNQYSDALRASGHFADVDLAEVRTRRGEVSFTLKLRFNAESISDDNRVAVESVPAETIAAEETEVADES